MNKEDTVISDSDMQRIIDNSNLADQRQYDEWVKAGKPDRIDAERIRTTQEIKETLEKDFLPFCPHYRTDFGDCIGCISLYKTEGKNRCKDLVWQAFWKERGL